MTLTELISRFMPIYDKGFADLFKGERVEEMDKAGVSNGWVVGFDKDTFNWDMVKAPAIPLLPAKRPSIESLKARIFLTEVQKQYHDNVSMILTLDTNGEGWSLGPVLMGDLRKDLTGVLKEYRTAKEQNDSPLAGLKRQAILLRTARNSRYSDIS